MKVIDKRDKSWHKRKGQIVKVLGGGEAEIKAIDDACGMHVVKHQDKLETVIPTVGKPVQVCGGKYKGKIGTLDAINETDFNANVMLKDGTLLRALSYEHICKVAQIQLHG